MLSLCSCGNKPVEDSSSESYSTSSSIVQSAIEIAKNSQDLTSTPEPESAEHAHDVTTTEVPSEWVTKDMEIPELPEIQYTSVPILDGYE